MVITLPIRIYLAVILIIWRPAYHVIVRDDITMKRSWRLKSPADRQFFHQLVSINSEEIRWPSLFEWNLQKTGNAEMYHVMSWRHHETVWPVLLAILNASPLKILIWWQTYFLTSKHLSSEAYFTTGGINRHFGQNLKSLVVHQNLSKLSR